MQGSNFKSRGKANTGLSMSPSKTERKSYCREELEKANANYERSSFLYALGRRQENTNT